MSRRRLAALPAILLLAGACRQAGAPPPPASRSAPAPAGSRAQETAGARSVEPPLAAMRMYCFENRLPDGSIVSFHYAADGERVFGILDYAFVEKDNARGTFMGRRDGDTITALWTHRVEGSVQVQEVLIRLDTDRAVKANGELAAGPDGVLRLTHPADAAFNETFARVRCD
jgi:hypothetical protein